jgi:hypothetical protein
VVDDDAIDPRPQRRLTAELGEHLENAQEDFLREVEGFLLIAKQVKGQLIHHPLVVCDQTRARVLVTGCTLLHQRPISAGRL